MTKHAWLGLAGVVLAISAVAIFGYRRWAGREDATRRAALAYMPPDATAVLFADLASLRQSPFLSELYKWAPHPQADSDYVQFVRATGFDYERDLDRVAVALSKRGQDTTFFAIAEGRFDRKKITAYAAQSATRQSRGRREIFSLRVTGNARPLAFVFLSDNRIALTDDPDTALLLAEPRKDPDTVAWRERFRRLAGSPVFAVVRQDAGAGTALSAEAPGGFHSPQLTAILDQLQWITIAGQPESDRLRVVLEGECAEEALSRQLSDLLNGVLVLAQAGLSEPKMRQQLDPQLREAYLEMLKDADVSRIDRGDTKSVRLVFDVTPQFLEAARRASAIPPPPPPVRTPQRSAPSRKK
jgi:hypothetical protein